MNTLVIAGEKAWFFRYKRKKFVGVTKFESVARVFGRVRGRVNVVFIDDSLSVRTFELPAMPPKEIDFVVSRELESEFGKDYAWTWIVAEVFFEGETRKFRVSAVLIRADRLRKLFQIIDRLRQEGARPKKLVPLGFSLFSREDCAVFCIVGGYFCGSFVKGGNPIFSRVFKLVDFSSIPDEVAKTINFARSKYGWEPPKILIFSDVPVDEDVKSSISALTGIEQIEMFDFEEISSLIPSSFPKDKTADFLPRENIIKKYYVQIIRYATWGLFALAGFQIIMGISKLNRFGEEKRRVTELEVRKRQLESRIKKLQRDTDIDPNEIVYVEAIKKITTPETSLRYAIAELARSIPPWLTVKSITLSREKEGWIMTFTGEFEVEKALDISERIKELENFLSSAEFFEKVEIGQPSIKVREGKISVTVLPKIYLVSE